MICTDCGAILTEEELYYYETRCDECEGQWLRDIEAWQRGEENEEFDRLFDGEKPITH